MHSIQWKKRLAEYNIAFLIDCSSPFLIALAILSKSYIADKLTQPKIDCCSQLEMLCYILLPNLLQQPIFSFSVDFNTYLYILYIENKGKCKIYNVSVKLNWSVK